MEKKSVDNVYLPKEERTLEFSSLSGEIHTGKKIYIY